MTTSCGCKEREPVPVDRTPESRASAAVRAALPWLKSSRLPPSVGQTGRVTWSAPEVAPWKFLPAAIRMRGGAAATIIAALDPVRRKQLVELTLQSPTTSLLRRQDIVERIVAGQIPLPRNPPVKSDHLRRIFREEPRSVSAVEVEVASKRRNSMSARSNGREDQTGSANSPSGQETNSLLDDIIELIPDEFADLVPDGASLIETLRFVLVWAYCPLPEDSYGRALIAAYVAGWAPFRTETTLTGEGAVWANYGSMMYMARTPEVGYDTSVRSIPMSWTIVLFLVLDMLQDNSNWFRGRSFTVEWPLGPITYPIGDALADIIEGAAGNRVAYLDSSATFNAKAFSTPVRYVAWMGSNIVNNYEPMDSAGNPYPVTRSWVAENDNCSPFRIRWLARTLVHELVHQAFQSTLFLQSGVSCVCLGDDFWYGVDGTAHWFCNQMAVDFVDDIYGADTRNHPTESQRSVLPDMWTRPTDGTAQENPNMHHVRDIMRYWCQDVYHYDGGSGVVMSERDGRWSNAGQPINTTNSFGYNAPAPTKCELALLIQGAG